MTMTTIKVTMETRDRLKSQAEAAGLTLGQHLERLARLGAREARRTAMRDTLARVTPEEWEDYSDPHEWDAYAPRSE